MTFATLNCCENGKYMLLQYLQLSSSNSPEGLSQAPAQCSVLSSLSLPRFKLFNLFTPTPGRLGHNSSVIVFF